MRYRLLIVIGVLAVLVMPTVSAAAPIGLARSAQLGSCPKVRHAATMRQTAASLPTLPAELAEELRRYGREALNATDLAWYDNGGRFGGGVPAAAVEEVMRAGLADGLSSSAVTSFLNPGFLRGISDPYGGGRILAFIVAQDDPTLFRTVAEYAATADPAIGGPGEAQEALFSAFPLLNVVYEAQAGVPPLDEAGAAIMEELANGGYRPAQRTIDRILAAGNHPQAGAQSSGTVADAVQPDVYDHLAMNYHGPLSPDARDAVANRTAYLDWVARIADWVASGATMDQVPSVPTFLTAGAAAPTVSAPTADRRNACWR